MLRNILRSLLTKGFVAVINFTVFLITSRYLGVESRGEISIFLLNISIIQIINEVFTGYSLVYFIPRYNFRSIMLTGLLFSAAVCAFCNTVLVATGKQIPGYEAAGYVISFVVVLNTFNCVLALGKENFRLYNTLCFLQPFILVVGILCTIFGLEMYTFEAYLYPLIVSFFVSVVISGIAVLRMSSTGKVTAKFSFRQIIVNGLMFQASLLMFVFCNRYSYYLLSGNENVGLFSSALQLMEAVLIISTGISPVLLARVANIGNTSRSAYLALSMSKYSFFFGALTALIICLIPERAFMALLGHGFSGIHDIMRGCAPAYILLSFSIPLLNHFSASGKQKLLLLSYLPGFVCTLFLAPVLVSRYGIPGAVVAVNVAFVLIAITSVSTFVQIQKIGIRRFVSVKGEIVSLLNFTGLRKIR